MIIQCTLTRTVSLEGGGASVEQQLMKTFTSPSPLGGGEGGGEGTYDEDCYTNPGILDGGIYGG